MIIDKKTYLTEKPDLNLRSCSKCHNVMDDDPEFGILESMPPQIQCVCPSCGNVDYRQLNDQERQYYCYGLQSDSEIVVSKYEVIAEFPGMEFSYSLNKGDILHQFKNSEIRNQNGKNIFPFDFEKFPAIFKKIEDQPVITLDTIKMAIVETTEGIVDWLQKETDLKDVGMSVEQEQIDRVINKYIYPRLVKHGIIFT